MPNLPSGMRGVLGEDYLQNFDVLIDYRHEVIQLESGLGSMAESLKGEHLPIELNTTVQGEPVFGRLVVTGHIPDLGDNSLSLLIDSGATRFTLFRESLGIGANNQPLMSVGVKSTSLFHSILISHQGKFVILNPSLPRQTAKVGTPPSTEQMSSNYKK